MSLMACCAMVACTAGSALAVGIAGDQFVYAAGTPLPLMGGGFGWAGMWMGNTYVIAAPPTLAYPLALPSAGNAIQTPATGEAWRVLPGGVTNFGNDIWVSWMELTGIAGGTALVRLDPPGAGFGTLSIFKDAAGIVWASTGGVPVAVGPSAGVGGTDFFVVRLRQFAAGTGIAIYLNPGLALSAAVPNLVLADPLPYSPARYYWRGDGGQRLDEIRIGTGPGDVALLGATTCYANCDGSTTVPCLNVNDFACFLNKFAAGDPYANCDGSTTAPVLNVNDFGCYLNKFAAGCSNC